MTTPASTLITRPGARLAYVLEIEGHDVAFTDVPDLTFWGNYTVRPGLQMRGTISRQIDLLGFNLSPVGFQFELVDAIPWSVTGSLARLFAEFDASAIVTELMADVGRTDTTIPVRSTAKFPPAGVIHLGHERIEYAGKTAGLPGTSAVPGTPATFTGCIRGTFPAGASAAAPHTRRWAHTHRISDDGPGPEVASKIRVWKNRMVTLYVTAYDPDTGAWNSRSDALNEIVGTIEDYKPSGRVWSISCVTIEKRMQGQLFKSQYRGAVKEGVSLRGPARLRFHSHVLGAHRAENVTITIPAKHYTLSELINEINAQLLVADLVVNLAPFELAFGLGGEHVWFRITVLDGGTYTSTVSSENNKGSLVMRVLGWPTTEATVSVIAPEGGSSRAIEAPERAIATHWTQLQQGALEVQRSSGKWENQPSEDLPELFPDAHGFVRVGDSEMLWLVRHHVSALGNESFTWVASYTLSGRQITTGRYLEEQIRHVGDDQIIPVRQVWSVSDTVSRLLLRMLLSTGTAGYNHPTYDKWPASMSCGLPANLVDVSSIEALGPFFATGLFQILLEPENAADHIESLMRAFGFHLVWRRTATRYQLVATIPTTIASLDAVHTLDSNNTGNQHYTDSSSGAELVRNRITLRYNRDPLTGEFRASETFENLSGEHDEPSALEYDALALHDHDGSKLSAWRVHAAAPMCAYFARPLRTHTRSGSRALWFLSVGDVVVLTDPDAPDATSGTYGTTSVKAWVTGVTKNYDTYELDSITLVVPPSNTARLAPSAMLDYTRPDKGYDAANRRLYVRPSEFTRPTEANDVTWFFPTDRVSIIEVDPQTPGSATTWGRVVEAVGSDYLQLTGPISNPPFDPTKHYYVTLRPYASAIQNPARNKSPETGDPGERVVSFMADDSDVLDDGTAEGQSAMLWGQALAAFDEGLSATGDEHYRLPPVGAGEPNAPLSAHVLRDLAYAVNNLYRHVCNQHPISEQFEADRTNDGDEFALLAGPYKIWCPFGARTLVFSIDAFCSGAGNFRITCSAEPPTGDSTTIPEYEGPITQVVATTPPLSTMTKIGASIDICPNSESYTYVTVEGHASSKIIGLRGVSAYYAPRSVS